MCCVKFFVCLACCWQKRKPVFRVFGMCRCMTNGIVVDSRKLYTSRSSSYSWKFLVTSLSLNVPKRWTTACQLISTKLRNSWWHQMWISQIHQRHFHQSLLPSVQVDRERERERGKKDDFCSDKPFLFISMSHLYRKLSNYFNPYYSFRRHFWFLYCVSLNKHIFFWPHSSLELLLTQYCADGKIETNEMGRTCGTYEGR